MNVLTDNAEALRRMVLDPFFPHREFEHLTDTLQSEWRKQVVRATSDAMRAVHTSNDPSAIMRAFDHTLGGGRLARVIGSGVNASIVSAYHRGKRETNSEAHDQKKQIRRDVLNVEVVDGMSEFDAIRTLEDQITIAAGNFWDERLQESIRSEISSWYDGALSGDELAAKLKDLVNERLIGDGKSTLPDVYFRQLAHHSIVRTRSVSKFARAKELGAIGYKLINPMDARTSIICKTLVRRATVYPLSAAQGVVDDLLTARSTVDLKATQPFWKSPDEDRIPFPPLHWGECRTTIRIVFR